MIALASRRWFTIAAALDIALAAAAQPVRATEIDPATPDYLRPLDAQATVETHYALDGRLIVRISGERFDGRRLVTSLINEAWRGEADGGADFDLHVQVAALAGLNDETVYDVDLALSRRSGRMSAFDLTARSRSYGPLRGALKTRRDGQPLVVVETEDAGALLRFTDIFAHVTGGRGAIAVDLATSPNGSRDGLLSLRDFNIAPDRLLPQVGDSLLGPPPRPATQQLEVLRLRAHYTITAGKLTIPKAILHGPTLDATLNGFVAGNDLNLRGYLAPHVRKEMQTPPCPNAGCLSAMPFTVRGTPQAPAIQINSYIDILPRDLFDEP